MIMWLLVLMPIVATALCFAYKVGIVVTLTVFLLSPLVSIFIGIVVEEMEDGKRIRALRLLRKAKEAKVCWYSHSPLGGPCLETGCEHSVPHICEGNCCLERKHPCCVPATIFGYKLTPQQTRDLETIDDDADEPKKPTPTREEDYENWFIETAMKE